MWLRDMLVTWWGVEAKGVGGDEEDGIVVDFDRVDANSAGEGFDFDGESKCVGSGTDLLEKVKQGLFHGVIGLQER